MSVYLFDLESLSDHLADHIQFTFVWIQEFNVVNIESDIDLFLSVKPQASISFARDKVKLPKESDQSVISYLDSLL